MTQLYIYIYVYIKVSFFKQKHTFNKVLYWLSDTDVTKGLLEPNPVHIPPGAMVQTHKFSICSDFIGG